MKLVVSCRKGRKEVGSEAGLLLNRLLYLCLCTCHQVLITYQVIFTLTGRSGCCFCLKVLTFRLQNENGFERSFKKPLQRYCIVFYC